MSPLFRQLPNGCPLDADSDMAISGSPPPAYTPPRSPGPEDYESAASTAASSLTQDAPPIVNLQQHRAQQLEGPVNQFVLGLYLAGITSILLVPGAAMALH